MTDFDSINVGDIEKIFHTITAEDIDKFVELTGDDNKLHLDESFASRTSFKKPVVHGMLGASFISTIIGTKLPGDGALWHSQTLEFLLPVRIGDKLKIVAEVLKKRKTDRTLFLKTDIFNQNKQQVLRGEAQVKVPKFDKKISSTKIIDASERVALVIGGTGGIGKATALALADESFNVVLHYNKNLKLARSIKEEIGKKNIKCEIVEANIGSEKEIEDMISKVIRWFGRIDILINCANSGVSYKNYEDLSWEDYNKEIKINVKSFFDLMSFTVPHMRKHNYGKIIGVTTQATELLTSQFSHYITAKSSLEGFLKSSALELAGSGIRVNLVSPGMTDTDFVSNIPEKARLVSAARTPMRKIAEPEDVANAIVYLASGKSDYLTGETIRVNGGQLMR